MPELSRTRAARTLLTAVVLGSLVIPAAASLPVRAGPEQPGFVDTQVLTGLTQPTAVEFAADGRVFVAEKSGIIRVFSSISAPSSSVFADLRTQVHNFWDRGLLGLALHPNFPTDNRVYVLYAHDAIPGGTAPRWGDGCPSPPGATDDGCLVTGRLSYLSASGNVSTGETVLITDWCQQFPSHSIGDLAFGPDGALFVSGGDGASFNYADYGQAGGSAGSPVPRNPCGDPPSGAGGTQTVPTAEGGALRSQDLRTAGDPVTLNGAILRLDPNTGAAMIGNPLIGHTDPNARRIVASGLRNPFRITVRPGTNEVWAGDVGWSSWEEINRVADPTSGPVNFGWPCYRGSDEPTRHVPGHEHLHGAARAGGAVQRPTSATPTASRSRTRRARPGAARRFRGWPSTRAAATRPNTAGRSSSPTTRGAASG